MEESISAAAGAAHGSEVSAEPTCERVIRGAGRVPVQRTTLYGQVVGAAAPHPAR